MAIVLGKAVTKHYVHIFSKKVLLKESGTGKDYPWRRCYRNGIQQFWRHTFISPHVIHGPLSEKLMANREETGNKGKHLIELVEYTDPYCTWCWGSEPILRKIKELYGDQVKITFKMGGLVEDIANFYDPLNLIGGEGMFEQVAAHWEDASKKHGMPVDPRVFQDIAKEFRSTYPANVAYKAAQMQSQELADRFLRRMREAAAAERRALHRREVQIELAGEVGLDVRKFKKALEDGSAEKAFREELRECRALGVTGFPTFYIKNRQGEAVVLNGYRTFESFERAFKELVGDGLVKRRLEATHESILAFIAKYGKVTTKEVAEVFGLTEELSGTMLRTLEVHGKIEGRKAGNGYFWLLKTENRITVQGQRFTAMECDTDTMICHLPSPTIRF